MVSSELPPDPNGIGLSAPEHTGRQRELLDQVNQLHSTGVHVDIDLPQICVIGSQSSGKSSLIESISGITLPRDTGTCTRCPIECRLAHSAAAWTCKISLQFIWDASGQFLPQARNEPFGNPITDKSLVEDRIRRAQRAILNPATPSHRFLTGNETIKNECDFSKNRVLLQISGPDVADLSFCDLPGLIASVSGQSAVDNIDLVQDLVRSYIERPSCVILVTVACETDFENQGAHRLAKEYDPEGERTIGVLTKPDRIPPGEEERWIRFIKNMQEPLKHNWFCVKQPSSQELKEGVTWTGARERENRFFSTQRSWSELDAIYKRYLGTANLVGRLSLILSDLIETRLPHIQAEVDSAISSVEDELDRLPKEPSQDPVHEVMGLLQRFIGDLQEEIRGRPDPNGLIQTIRPHHDDFRQSIRGTVPCFLPFEEKGVPRKMEPFIFLHEEDDDDSSDGTDDTSTSNFIYVDEVLKRSLGARARELPGHTPFSVQKHYIDQFLAHWPAPAIKLCRLVYDTLNERVNRLVKEHFSTFGQGALEHPVRLLLQDHLRACRDRGKAQIEWLLSLEKLAFTSNSSKFAFYQAKFLVHYRTARHAHPSNLPIQFPEYLSNKGGVLADVLSGLSKMGMPVREEDLSKLLHIDQMDLALPIMADVRAYFQVAYQRFADSVPMAVDVELVQGLGRDLFQTLSSGLGIYGPSAQDKCREWAKEHPDIDTRRAQLKKKLERLQDARLKFAA
ncbi:hypothetical protein BDN72DRAFT_772573 [Pluteus cervinus]|uniref:Uncharacterized protein n=1 Tax=Pluteus cervinus TaxID=181527 RepID=A0ACD3AK15_9AGAR|nr:hypothetical protein BDN72DRAFT_772573 [Pluteus cervinus]